MLKFSYCTTLRLKAALLSLCVLSFGVQADVAPERRAALMQDYIAATEGDSDARKRAFEGYGKLIEEDPSDAVAQAYYGGVMTIKGRDAWMPWNKMKHTEKGLDLMASAVSKMEKSSDDSEAARWNRVDVNSLAGISFTQVPDMFGRFGEGYDLLSELVNGEEIKVFPIEKVAFIYFFAGQAAEKKDQPEQAIGFYTSMLERGATGKYADLANQTLQTLGAAK